jgi:hypothetical protein
MNRLAWQIPLWALAAVALRRLLLAPFWMAQEDEKQANVVKERLDNLEARLEKQGLSSILRIRAHQLPVQFRSPKDMERMSAEIVGWMFRCPIIITNISDKSKLSLVVSLKLKMKGPFAPELILADSTQGGGKMLWNLPDALGSPLSVQPQDSISGVFYFWTGPIMDEKPREEFSEMIEREQNLSLLIWLVIHDLVSGETVDVKLPTEG